MKRRGPARPLALAATAAACLATAPAQDGLPRPAESVDDALVRARAAERRRIDTIRRVVPSVCCVMHPGKPGGGSGVVFDRAGFVLTNFHVVGEPSVERMQVGLPDGGLYGATVLGIDPGSDLAVLLLDPRTRAGGDDPEPDAWPWSPLGDSDRLRQGQPVLAVGNPFLLATDFTPTVTWGVVSGVHRYQPGPGNRALVYPDCIQVDAPINPGNSGGPLFDESGHVVGINGRISVRDRGRVNVGVGFAIAANQIRNFLGDLMAGRHAEHGTLDLNAWLMEAPSGHPGSDEGRMGVFVQSTFADATVTRFGMGLGDELLALEGVPIRGANDLARRIGVLPAGSWVSLTFRPRGPDAGPRTIEFPLTRLDTGSSRDPDRIAQPEHRRTAARAVLRGRTGSWSPSPCSEVVFRGPDGETVVVRRRGDALRVDGQEVDGGPGALVDPGGGAAPFALRADGTARDAAAPELAKMAVLRVANPWLRPGGFADLASDGAILQGGVLALGRPAWRIGVRVRGDDGATDDPRGPAEVYVYEDGEPAGCRYFDPLQQRTVDLRHDGDRTRLIVDGVLADGWSLSTSRPASLDPELFRRP